MPQISHTCPHCLTENAAFTVNGALSAGRTSGPPFISLLQCQVCRGGAVGLFPDQFHEYWVDGRRRGPDDGALDNLWPKPPPNEAPRHLPDHLRSLFLQGQDALRRAHYDAAGPVFRRCLEVALKKIHPEAKPRASIYDRIESLPDNLGVTSAMKQWAHAIRKIGNDAAHEDEPFSAADAEALHSFTELFLTYTFTLPAMLDERRRQAEKLQAEEAK